MTQFVAMIAAAVLVALGIMAGAALATKRPPQRHHIYWCQYPGIGNYPPGHPYAGYPLDPKTGTALPCMYRKNDPVDV